MASTPSAFTSDVMARIQRRYGAAPEFLWKRTPDNAIFRTRKMANGLPPFC